MLLGSPIANARTLVFALVGALALGACGGERTTRVQLTIERGDAEVDDYQLRIASATVTRSARADVLSELTLLLPDEMGGASTTVEVWGLQVGAQRAYGNVTFTPRLHETLAVSVSLTMVSCELWCDPGSAACESDGVVACMQDANGCFGRGEPAPCDEPTPFCSDGMCAASCSDECVAGETSCDSAVAVRECGNNDNDPCMDWSAPLACPSGESCIAGQCTTTTICSEGEDCDDGNACTVDDTCSGGACIGTPCIDVPHGASTCGANGSCSVTCDVGFVKAGDGCMFVPPAAMPTPRRGMAVVAAGGLIYAIGGFTYEDGEVGTNEAYDPATNTWKTLAPMPTDRTDAAGVLGPDGKIYVIGGSFFYLGTYRLGVVEAYDPATNTWLARSSMPTLREELAAVVGSDGRIYAFGGRNHAGMSSAVEVYDPVTNAWTARSPLSFARHFFAAASVGDRIYVMGGATDSSSLATVEAYHPALDAWIARAPMPTARGALTAAVGADGKIYAFGGSGASAVVEAYDPGANQWTERTTMPSGRSEAGAARGPNQLIYVIGGNPNSATGGQSGTVEAFDPPANLWQ